MGNERAGHRFALTVGPVPGVIAPAPGAIHSRAKVRQISEHCGGFGTEPYTGLV